MVRLDFGELIIEGGIIKDTAQPGAKTAASRAAPRCSHASPSPLALRLTKLWTN